MEVELTRPVLKHFFRQLLSHKQLQDKKNISKLIINNKRKRKTVVFHIFVTLAQKIIQVKEES